MKTVEIDGVSLTEEQVMQAYKKLQEPEFEYPMSSPKRYERCKEGYSVHGTGECAECFQKEHIEGCYDNFNLFPTREIAKKAAKLMHESNKLIMACLEVDPDYEPDWSDDSAKHSVYFNAILKKYTAIGNGNCKRYAAYVSTIEKAEKVRELMNEWRHL